MFKPVHQFDCFIHGEAVSIKFLPNLAPGTAIPPNRRSLARLQLSRDSDSLGALGLPKRAALRQDQPDVVAARAGN